MKVVVIGGVAAGMSAASKIKRIDPQAEVVVYEKGRFLSYGACGLPYYVGGFNDDYTKLIARPHEQFEKMGIVVHINHEVLKVIPKEKKLLIRNYESGDLFITKYDKLMIGTGAEAIKPTFPGTHKKGIYQLKTLEDALALKEVVKNPNIKKVVVIGGGYIGIETVDAFLNLGKEVTCIEYASRILMSFDEEIAIKASEELVRKGVCLKVDERVVEFRGEDAVKSVITNQGEYEADLVVLAIGIRPATSFLKDTGIQMAENGAIVVDREMKSSVRDIWAAGDCATVYNRTLEENSYLALGTVANKCGRIAGENITGKHKKFIGALGSAAIKVCGLELGRTGLGEYQAMSLALNYKTNIIEVYDHPAYYPGQTPMMIKIIYEAHTKKLLGAQAIGLKGAVIRIDVFAVAIQSGMSIDELGMTDLVYAPPFAGVWDAIHIACNAAK